MTGFLSLFEGTEQVHLAQSGPLAEYWVEIKQYLTSEDYDEAKKALTQVEFTPGVKKTDEGTAKPDPNVPAYQRELVIAAIVNWNLTDQNGGALPLQPVALRRASVKRLPELVVSRLYARIDQLEEEEPAEEQVKFPGAASGSDSPGDGRPTDPAAVLDGAGVVAAVGSDTGGGA